MRISDWSSDVCSSDLNEVRLERHVTRFEHDLNPIAACEKASVRAVVATAIAQIIDGRSEEHTSELQSLMRISYAVFCLKKKNTKNKKTTHHTKTTNQILRKINH